MNSDPPHEPLSPGEIRVRLLNFPLEVYRRAQEHADGLVREFAIIAQGRANGTATDIPERLLAIVDSLSTQYAQVSSAPEAERDAALDRGQTYLDLTYQVPIAAAEASNLLGHIFDEADAYCAQGRHLLSLSTPPESRAFRRWFLGQFVEQSAGRPPTPWPPPPAVE
jgi:hypothetical protein